MPHSPAKNVQSATKPPLSKITLTLTDELKEALIKRAKEMFGDRRGAISIFVEMTLRNDLKMGQPEVEET